MLVDTVVVIGVEVWFVVGESDFSVVEGEDAGEVFAARVVAVGWRACWRSSSQNTLLPIL